LTKIKTVTYPNLSSSTSSARVPESTIASTTWEICFHLSKRQSSLQLTSSGLSMTETFQASWTSMRPNTCTTTCYL